MNGLKPYLNGPVTAPDISLHNPSTWSDGAASPREMCRAARAAGVTVFGLSDHYADHPAPECRPVSWSLDLTRLDAYAEELVKLKEEVNDGHFTLLAGLEVDSFSENIRDVLARLAGYPLDYLIGSVHYVGSFSVDHSPEPWRGLTAGEIDRLCLRYWEKVREAAACPAFAFLGHLDLPKKFGFIPDCRKYLPDAVEALDIAAANGVAIELNTAGWFKPCGEAYPSPAILREAGKRKIPVVISSDAHSPEHITRGFREAELLLDQAGVSGR